MYTNLNVQEENTNIWEFARVSLKVLQGWGFCGLWYRWMATKLKSHLIRMEMAIANTWHLYSKGKRDSWCIGKKVSSPTPQKKRKRKKLSPPQQRYQNISDSLPQLECYSPCKWDIYSGPHGRAAFLTHGHEPLTLRMLSLRSLL